MSAPKKEYIVTLKDYNFLEEFYKDLETEGTAKSYIPSRKVECLNRRPISRNTHYLLTDEEARIIKNDPRVENINLRNLDIKIKLHSSQTAGWNRGSDINVGEKNWGLYRTQLSQNIPQWGSESNLTDSETSTIDITGTGKNVDIIFVDETVYPNHSEFGGRFVQYDWFANHNSTVWPSNPNSTYSYNTFDGDNNHATHVAAISVGITQGWAREANIYNIRHDSAGTFAGSFIAPEYLIDYIRAFHNNKSINPQTGRRNPTLVNNSWGFEVNTGARNPYTGGVNSYFSKVVYRGTEVTGSVPSADTGISGACTADVLVSSFNSLAPGSGNRLVTTGLSTGTITPITFSNTNKVGLTNLGVPSASGPLGLDANDDAYWQLSLPFPITYLTQSYQNDVFLSSNSLITFGSSGFEFDGFTPTDPDRRKIFVSTGDRYCQSLWAGTFGTLGNRTYVVRFEGFDGPYSPSVESTPTLVWEVIFYEAVPSRIDFHIVSNSVYRPEFTTSELINYGINFNDGAPAINNVINADILDAINDGIIFVSSAGNNGTKIDILGGQDYNNYFIEDGLPIYYHRGGSPASSHPDMICVGSLSSVSTESKSVTSNTGPGVDIYAPGDNIISAVHDKFGLLGNNATASDRHLTISSGYAGTGSSLAQADRAAIVTSSAHGLSNGNVINIDNCSNSVYNVTNVTVTVINSTTFSFSISNTSYTNASESLTGIVKVGNIFQKWSGTSMAAAQVTGLLALALEQYPWMTQSDAKNYILNYSKSGLMTDSAGGYSDVTSLQGGDNKIAYFFKERPSTGTLIPKANKWLRPQTGQLYPRSQIRRK